VEVNCGFVSGCSPIYKEDACCPIAWVCPKSSEPVEEPEEEAAPKTSQMIICPPGVQIRPGNSLTANSPLNHVMNIFAFKQIE